MTNLSRSIGQMVPLIITSVQLTACVPLFPYPVSEGHLHTRENLRAHIPEFITPGQTTIENVLMKMGGPDAVATDESWLEYGTCYGQSGLGLVFLAGGPGGGIVGNVSMQNVKCIRLIIQFNQFGVVSDSIFETKECSAFDGNAMDGCHEECLDLCGKDIPRKHNLQWRRWP